MDRVPIRGHYGGWDVVRRAELIDPRPGIRTNIDLFTGKVSLEQQMGTNRNM
jgi:hypothetical protein